MTQYRHGDLLIVPVDSIPQGAKQTKKTKDRILAYGEVTGHAHRLSDGLVLELEGRTYFKTTVETTLSHEEHGPLKFKPGNYMVTHQREYSPERGAINVRD
jgi:hypothetical protein